MNQKQCPPPPHCRITTKAQLTASTQPLLQTVTTCRVKVQGRHTFSLIRWPTFQWTCKHDFYYPPRRKLPLNQDDNRRVVTSSMTKNTHQHDSTQRPVVICKQSAAANTQITQSCVFVVVSHYLILWSRRVVVKMASTFGTSISDKNHCLCHYTTPTRIPCTGIQRSQSPFGCSLHVSYAKGVHFY